MIDAHSMRRRARLLVLASLACVVAVLALFAWNGTRETWRVPSVGHDERVTSERSGERARTVRVMALNVAKAWFHRGGLDFASVDAVRANLDRVASEIRAEDPDVVCLSEVVMEAAPHDLDQVEHLARACGSSHWASGEHYSFGIPGFRIRSGNAVLSKLEMRALDVQQLAGESSIFDPTGNRRALWFEVRVNGEWLLGASIRNDSFDLANNARQVDEILARVGDRPALLAGDFNAVPGSPPMERLRESARFGGFVDGPPTFPASAPTRRIDHVLVPASWRLLEAHVVDTGVSDHLAVVATFASPE